MSLSELMMGLAGQLGLDPPVLEPDGGAQLLIDNELAIDVTPVESGAGFTVSATVGVIPADRREAVFAQMLEANLLGDGTAGGALALDSALNEVVLCRVFPDDTMPVTTLDRELAAFVEALRWWRERLSNGELGGAGRSKSSETFDQTDMLRI